MLRTLFRLGVLVATESLPGCELEKSTGIRLIRFLAGAIGNGLIFAFKVGESSGSDGIAAGFMECMVGDCFPSPE